MTQPAAERPLLSLDDISVSLRNLDLAMVTGVSFDVMPREIFGIVGESGSGKTLLTRTVFALHEDTFLSAGRVTFDGATLPLGGYHRAMKALLGKAIGYIPQDPFSSLNPSMRVGAQIAEALYLARGIPPKSDRARQEVAKLLAEVGIPEPEVALRQYPDQFSGGMRQRIVIAIALSQNPRLLIADEPTTALDAFTQRRVMELLIDRSRNREMAVLLISHNLELLRQSVDRMAVLYAGQLLNVTAAADVGARPVHPYMQALFDCMPTRDKALADIRPIAGEPAGAGFGTRGCAFASRCPHAADICRTAKLPRNGRDGARFSACILGMGI